MGSNRLRPLEKIARTFAVQMGVINEGEKKIPAMTDSAIYLLRLNIKEYVGDIIGDDDMSPAAQRIRAELRRM